MIFCSKIYTAIHHRITTIVYISSSSSLVYTHQYIIIQPYPGFLCMPAPHYPNPFFTRFHQQPDRHNQWESFVRNGFVAYKRKTIQISTLLCKQITGIVPHEMKRRIVTVSWNKWATLLPAFLLQCQSHCNYTTLFCRIESFILLRCIYAEKASITGKKLLIIFLQR